MQNVSRNPVRKWENSVIHWFVVAQGNSWWGANHPLITEGTLSYYKQPLGEFALRSAGLWETQVRNVFFLNHFNPTVQAVTKTRLASKTSTCFHLVLPCSPQITSSFIRYCMKRAAAQGQGFKKTEVFSFAGWRTFLSAYADGGVIFWKYTC